LPLAGCAALQTYGSEWQDNGTNEDIRTTVQQRETFPDQYIIRQRKLRLFGTHLQDAWQCFAEDMVADDRQPGRASRRWIDDILKWRGKAMKGASGTDDKRQNSMAKVRG